LTNVFGLPPGSWVAALDERKESGGTLPAVVAMVGKPPTTEIRNAHIARLGVGHPPEAFS
jgi:hypothetical protein